ncbi:MAG: pilin [Candidatus Moranbacteria bacterium]|nr:pilin [Candidatus Moranbacteria bacterium]
MPNATDAAGLVPCGTDNNSPCTLCHLVVGIKSLIDWGFGVMTFFAIAVIVAMGIVYIVSAGNPSMTTTAKNGIKAALIGFLIMLGSWVIVNFFMLTLANNGVGRATSWNTFTCDTATKTQQINQTPATPGSVTGGTLSCTTGTCATNSQVSAAVRNNASGLNPNILMSIIDGGEGCNKASSPAGACGYSQVMPAYRKSVCGLTGTDADTCAAMQNDLQLDINCGAKFIATDFAVRCGPSITTIASCYNTGNRNNCGEGSPPYCQRVTSYYNSCP